MLSFQSRFINIKAAKQNRTPMMEAMASGTVDEFVKHPGKSFG